MYGAQMHPSTEYAHLAQWRMRTNGAAGIEKKQEAVLVHTSEVARISQVRSASRKRICRQAAARTSAPAVFTRRLTASRGPARRCATGRPSTVLCPGNTPTRSTSGGPSMTSTMRGTDSVGPVAALTPARPTDAGGAPRPDELVDVMFIDETVPAASRRPAVK